MYNNISNDAKAALKSRAVITTARITLTSDNTVIDGNNLQNITITDQCYENGVIVGTAMCKEVEIELIDNNYDLADKEFLLEVGVLLPNNTYEYIPYGNFVVKEYQKIISSGHYKLIAYDYMDRFNKVFEDPNDYTNTITLQEFYESVANFYDVEIESQLNLPNSDFVIREKPYFDNMSGRIVLSRIAEMMGCFAKINRNNKLEMKLKTITTEQFSRKDMNSSLERDNIFGPVNVVSLRLGQIEGENVTKRDEESIAQYGETTLQILDNPFVYTEALRLLAIDDIYNQVDGFSYYPTTFNGKLIYLDCGDVVQVQDMNTNTYYPTIILKQVLKIPSTRNSKFENKALTDTGLEYQYTPEQVQINRRTEYVIDKQNQKITEIVETTEEIEKEVEDIIDTVGFAEGQYIHIEDSSDQPIVSEKSKGYSWQATRSGKNLINVFDVYQLGNNVSIDNDGWITITRDRTGQSTVAYENFYFNPNLKLQTSTNYYFVLEVKEVSSQLGTSGINIVNTSTNNQKGQFASNWGLTLNNLSSGDVKIQRIMTRDSFSDCITFSRGFLSIVAGDRVSITFRLSVLEQEPTVQTFSYEPYGVMPSPDYPSDIRNVGDNINKFNWTGISNTNVGTFENGVATLNWSSGFNCFLLSSDNQVLSGLDNTKTYTISFKHKGNRIVLKDYQTSGNSVTTGNTNDYIMYSFSITGVTSIRLDINRSDTTGTAYIKEIKVEEGMRPSSCSPYNCGNFDIKIVNKNLFDGFVKGKGLDSTTGAEVISSNRAVSDYIPVDFNNNPSYYISGLTNTLHSYVAAYNSNKQFIGRTNANPVTRYLLSSTSFTNGTAQGTGDIAYIRVTQYYISVNTGTIDDIDNLQTQLEVGETSTSYIEHEEQNVIFPLSQGQRLMQGDYLADDGIHHKHKQVVVNITSDSIINLSSGNKGIVFYASNKIYKLSNYLLCSKAIYDNSRSGIENTVYENQANVVFVGNSTDTVETLKTKYNGGILEYELAEEEVEAYTEEQQEAWNKIMQLRTYKNITNIYSDAYTEIEYVKDNGLNIYETRANATRKYTETTQKFAQQQITNDSITSTVSQVSTTVTNNYNELKTKFDDYATTGDVESVQQIVETVQTSAEYAITVAQDIQENGTTKVRTEKGFTFDNDGLTIDENNSKTKSNLDTDGLEVIDKTGSTDQVLLKAGYDEVTGETIVKSKNMTVEKYLTIGTKSRIEDYEDGTGIFII